MSVRFVRKGTGTVTDHNELINRGVRTHAEIDSYMDELDDARGTNPSIGARLDVIEQTNTLQDGLISDHEQRIGDIEDTQGNQEDRLVTVEGDLSALITEIEDARVDIDGVEYSTLKLRLDALQENTVTKIDGNVVEIQVRRVTSNNLPLSAAQGEPIFTVDTRKLYFGQGPGLPLVEVVGSGPGGGGGGSGTFTGVPVGTTVFFTAQTPPAGWLVCDGSEVSRETYADLFSVIGTTYGEGDGVTTFNLPDLRGMFVRGWDAGRGVDAGRVFGSEQEDAFKSHNHPLILADDYTGSIPSSWYLELFSHKGTISTSYIGEVGDTETRPKNIALLPCIKYQPDSLPDYQEVVDARTDMNGVEYDSLKERLDAMQASIGNGGGGGGGSGTVEQYTNMDVIAPLTVDVVIHTSENFAFLPVEVLKFIEGGENIVTNLYPFDNTDSARFNSPSTIVFDGVMKFKTKYVKEMVDHGALGDGRYMSVTIDKSSFKKILSMEVG